MNGRSEAGPLVRAWRLLRRALVAFALLFALVTFTPVLGLWVRALSGPWNATSGEILIVLGADSTTDRVLGLGSYWRAVYAVYHWRGGAFRTLVLSGAGGIAAAMRDFVVAHHVPPEAIRIEDQAGSTREQACAVAALLRQEAGRKVVLTSDYHSLRACRAFRKCGLEVSCQPAPDAGKRINSLRLRWDVFLDLSVETCKFGWYALRGWI